MADSRFVDTQTHPLESNTYIDINSSDLEEAAAGQDEPLLSSCRTQPRYDRANVDQAETVVTTSLTALNEILETRPKVTTAQQLGREIFYSLAGVSAVLLIHSDLLPPGNGVMPTGTEWFGQVAEIYAATKGVKLVHHAINEPAHLAQWINHLRTRSLGYDALIFAKRAVILTGSMAATAYSYSAAAHAIDVAAKKAEEDGIIDSPYYAATFLFGGLFTSLLTLSGMQRGVETVLQKISDKLLTLNEPEPAFDQHYTGWKQLLAGFANKSLDVGIATALYEFIRIGLQTFEGMLTQESLERSPLFPVGISLVGAALQLHHHLVYQSRPWQEMLQDESAATPQHDVESFVSAPKTLGANVKTWLQHAATPSLSSIAGMLTVFVFNQYVLSAMMADTDPENRETSERLGYYAGLVTLYFLAQACFSAVPNLVGRCRSAFFAKSPVLVAEHDDAQTQELAVAHSSSYHFEHP
jgi:hypothetical protein